MSIDWEKQAKEHWDRQPHPFAPTLKIADYATAVKLATRMKFGGHATPAEATLFWKEFGNLQMSPGQFTSLLDKLAPVSFAYHGRPPSMEEMSRLRDAQPHEIAKHFSDLPDKHYPELTAGSMVASLTAAKPFSQQYLDRPPTKGEAAHLHFGKESPSDYYQRLKLDQELKSGAQTPPVQDKLQGVQESGLPTQAGGNPGGRGLDASGRSAPGQ